MGRGDHLQGALELLVLKTLEAGPNHGFGITLRVQEASEGLLRIEEGSLYPALHRMEREKLVRGEWRSTGSGRRARYYTLTKSGKARLQEASAAWSAVSKGVHKVLGFA
jgi:transcriptional regulator